MLIVIAKRNDEVARFAFTVSHPDDLPLVCRQSVGAIVRVGWAILYRMFVFVDCGKAVVYDVDENGKWGED